MSNVTIIFYSFCLEQVVQEKYNNELNASLDKFIRDSFGVIDNNRNNVIPIGVLESGLSRAENFATFNHIQRKLKEEHHKEKVHVARVPSDVNSSAKAVFQKICVQIIYKDSVAVEDSDTDNSMTETFTTGNSRKKNTNLSLYDLKCFFSNEKSPCKIIVLIDDVEYFPNTVITQLLTLIGCSELPVVFIFGTIHGQFVNTLVPTNSSMEFLIEKFYSVTAKDRMNDFMRRVLLDCNNPFKISGRVASYLESHYQEDNFSVDSLFQSITFCLRLHFLSAKSAFCASKKSDDYTEEQLKMFNESFVEKTGAGPRKYSGNRKEQRSEDVLQSFDTKMQGWHFCLRLICSVNLMLTDHPLGETYPSMYSSFFSGHSSIEDPNTPLFKFFRSLQSTSKADLEYILSECVRSFEKWGKHFPNTALIETTTSFFQKLETDLVKEEKQNQTPEGGSKTTRLNLKRGRGNLKLAELKECLLEDKMKNEGTSMIHAVRKELAEHIKHLIKQFVPSYDSRNFLSVFIFDDLNHLINALFPANFLQLNEDIMNPGLPLECKCCSSLDLMSITESLPDVSIIFKLISEHTTKKVDLNLIYSAFVGIAQVETSGRNSKAAKDAATASYLTRFRRAVGELQHMGFIKRSKAKPDEVNRLTWW